MKRQEIGSEFWGVDCKEQGGNTLFPPTAQWYLCGRSALQAILARLKGKKTAALPSWCCHTMIKPFIDAGIEVKFYPVYFDGKFIQEPDYGCDILYVMDYFGFSSDMNHEHPCVIRDITHSIFSRRHEDAHYYYGSLRKWCGFWTGGYAWTGDGTSLPYAEGDDSQFIRLRQQGMAKKQEYITDSDSPEMFKTQFLDDFRQAEAYLESCGSTPAARRDVELALKLDADGLSRRRKANAQVLIGELPDFLIFDHLKGNDTPLFVPITVSKQKRDQLKSYLAEHHIYCPSHWPLSSYHKIDARLKTIYETEISLVCDQRYDENDMHRIAETIKNFFRNTES